MDHGKGAPRSRKAAVSDPRVSRTQELLVEAFIELCGERGMASVSVAEIARRAGVNRGTFYRHFEGKPDLLERGIETLLSGLFAEVEAAAPVGSGDEHRVLTRVTRYFETARNRSTLFRLLLSGAAGPLLLEKTEAFVETFLREKRLGLGGEGTLTLPLPMASRVLTAVLFGFTSWWIEHPRSFTAGQMASLCLTSVAHGLFRSPEGR